MRALVLALILVSTTVFAAEMPMVLVEGVPAPQVVAPHILLGKSTSAAIQSRYSLAPLGADALPQGRSGVLGACCG